jgi:hypothetical protein
MKRILSIVVFTVLLANPVLAQDTGGDTEITVQDSKGTRTVRDTTVHTTTSNGTGVSTSLGSDGKPNGGGGPSETPAGPGGASYEGP